MAGFWDDILGRTKPEMQFNSDLIDTEQTQPNPVLTGQRSDLIGKLMEGIPGASGYPITKEAEDKAIPPIPMRIDEPMPTQQAQKQVERTTKKQSLGTKATQKQDTLADSEIVPIESLQEKEVTQTAPEKVTTDSKEVKPQGPDLSDPEMTKALEDRKNMMILQALIRSGNQIGSAIAGVKQPANYLSEYDQIIQEPVESLKTMRAGQKDKREAFRQSQQDAMARDRFELDKQQAQIGIQKATAEMDNVKAMQDPNSDISRAIQDAKIQELDTYAKLTGLPINTEKLRGMSGKGITDVYGKSNMENVFSAYVRAQAEKEARRMQLEESKLRREEMKSQKEIARKDVQDRYDTSQVERYTKMVHSSEPFKEAERIINATSKVRELAKDAATQGGQSLAMLGPAVAKGLAGEVGVLTDKDVTRYTQNPAAIEGMVDTLQKVKAGKLSQVSYDNLIRLTEIMERKAKDARSVAYKRGATQLSRNSSIPLEKAYELLNPDALEGAGLDQPAPEAPKASAMTPAQEAGIAAVMTKNPKATREQVIEALKKQGKLK